MRLRRICYQSEKAEATDVLVENWQVNILTHGNDIFNKE